MATQTIQQSIAAMKLQLAAMEAQVNKGSGIKSGFAELKADKERGREKAAKGMREYFESKVKDNERALTNAGFVKMTTTTAGEFWSGKGVDKRIVISNGKFTATVKGEVKVKGQDVRNLITYLKLK